MIYKELKEHLSDVLSDREATNLEVRFFASTSEEYELLSIYIDDENTTLYFDIQKKAN